MSAIIVVFFTTRPPGPCHFLWQKNYICRSANSDQNVMGKRKYTLNKKKTQQEYQNNGMSDFAKIP
jgi:hypothetical protein